MSLGQNISFLRKQKKITQEQFAERMNVTRQTVSRWESDEITPELSKLVDMSEFLACNLDALVKENLSRQEDIYSEVQVKKVPAFRYASYAIISREPESDALGYMQRWAEAKGFKTNSDQIKFIGWDFPFVSQEQQTRFGMHGYVAACVLPDDFAVEDGDSISQNLEAEYAAITIKEPFIQPFERIPNAYKLIMDYLQANNFKEKGQDNIIGCFEREYEKNSVTYMDIYIHMASVTKADALTITGISRRAFHSDVEVGSKEKTGPPGYMSVPFHAKMARSNHLFKLVDNGLIIGGAILFEDHDKLSVSRIFISQENHRKGYGEFMMREIEALYPTVKEFTLDTPIWNVRTNAFYTKMGYRSVRHDNDFVYFSKQCNG